MPCSGGGQRADLHQMNRLALAFGGGRLYARMQDIPAMGGSYENRSFSLLF